MTARQKVSVVIPNWNGESHLKKNMASVFEASREAGAEVIVVDDNSKGDNSISYLESLGNKIKLIKNKQNQGFAYSVNRGVQEASGDIVILLNTDVQPAKDCFVQAIKKFSDSSIFAVTFNSHEGWAGGRWSNGLLEHFPINSETSNTRINFSLWASGGQAAFDKDKWVKLGGLDLIYKPFYWEDVDLGYRAWKRGWKIIWDPKAKCQHLHKQGVISHNFSSKLISHVAYRNQLIFVWKNIHNQSFVREHILRLPKLFLHNPLAFMAAFLRLPIILSKRAVEKRDSLVDDAIVLREWN